MFKGLRFAPGRRRWLIPTLLGLLITALVFSAFRSQPAVIERLGNLVFDSYQRVKPRAYDPDLPVRIIDIDEASINAIGQWPWPRTTIAQLNDRLFDAGAAVVAYDIVFSESDRTSPENMAQILRANPGWTSAEISLDGLASHDALLAQSFAQSNVVGAFFLGTETGLYAPQKNRTVNWGGEIPYGYVAAFAGATASLPVLQEGMSGEGFINVRPGAIDGIVRSAPMVARTGEMIYPSLSMETLRAVQGLTFHLGRSSTARGQTLAGSQEDSHIALLQSGDFEIPVTEGGDIIIYYTEAIIPERYISAADILTEAGWEERIAGHIVYIGTSAEGLKDIRATPMNPFTPGVEIHAQITEQILSQSFLKRPYTVVLLEAATILGFGLLLSLILPHLSALKGAILALIMGGGAFWTSWHAFAQEQTLINPVYPLLTVAACYLLMTLASLYLAETDRARIRGAFSMYLSPAMVRKVSEDPDALKLGGEDRRITILFLDVRSFSAISERLTPAEITQFLNLFLTPMTDILQDHQATIDKYIGDAIVAFWNAPLDDPQHEINSARAVLAMSAELQKLNTEYARQDAVKWPDPLRIGLGVNTGICTVGNLGSKQRFSYSMIGDAANLASRIEGLTKAYGLEIMLGSETAQALPDFAVLEIDRIKVIGRETPETVYTLLGDERVRNGEAFKSLLDTHSRFLMAYRAMDWKSALGLLDTLSQMGQDFGLSAFYAMMAARIKDYQKNPPGENWDGVHIAQSK